MKQGSCEGCGTQRWQLGMWCSVEVVARCAVIEWGMCGVIKICTKLLVLGWILEVWWLLVHACGSSGQGHGAWWLGMVCQMLIKFVLSPELRPACLEWVIPQENIWVGGTASRLGSNYLCNATSCSWLCVYVGGRGGKCCLPAHLFPEKSVPQQT